jgi:hypothetical protein
MADLSTSGVYQQGVSLLIQVRWNKGNRKNVKIFFTVYVITFWRYCHEYSSKKSETAKAPKGQE